MAKLARADNVGIVALNSIVQEIASKKSFLIIAPTNGYPLDDSEDLGENGIYDYEFILYNPRKLVTTYGTVRVKQRDIVTLYELCENSCKNFMEIQKLNLTEKTQQIVWG